MSATMKAMILAAGFGERLWPLSCDRTKPAFPVLGKPLVGFVAEYLAQYGFNQLGVTTPEFPTHELAPKHAQPKIDR